MRGGATQCSVHQTLTSEAASVLKLSLGLARRRGHAQVTPLHVAFTLLSSSRASDLLRRACLKSQRPVHGGSYPLQCRALELCFNVALNRLPTITSPPPPAGPFLHAPQPSLSNALVAALKRAQAHQRRGCIEQQQQQQNQPLLAAKVELEQLVLSILDDPSVSRVMREAGFSSTAVKTNIEESLSSSPVFQLPSINGSCGVFSSPPSPTREAHQHHQLGSFWPPQLFSASVEQNPLLFSISPHKNYSTPTAYQHLKEDVKLVVEVMVRRKRSNPVIVGDSLSITDGLVMELRERLARGDVPLELKSVRFIDFQFQPEALKLMKQDEVETRYLSELRRKVERSSGAIVYVGDLKWAVHDDETIIASAVDHVVKEIGKLASYDRYGTSGSPPSPRVWVVGTASFQTYMKCQIRFQPPLDLQWGIQAVSVPSGGLGLSLHGPSLNEPRVPFLKSASSARDADELSCCGECTSNYEKEAEQCKSTHHRLLPPWLQPLGTGPPHEEELVELRRKWSKLCKTLHQGKHMTQTNLENPTFYSTSSQNTPVSSKQFSYRWPSQNTSLFPDTDSISFTSPSLKAANSVPRFRRQNSCTLEFDLNSRRKNPQPFLEPNLSSLRNTAGGEVKITLALGNETDSLERTIRKGEMCRVIKDYVPWQSENVPGIVDALMDSGLAKKETWLLIQGNDRVGKIRLASAIGESVFGSADSVLCLNMRTRNSKEVDPLDQVLGNAVGRSLRNLVVLVEDVEFAENWFMKFLMDRFEARKSMESGNREGDAVRLVFMLTKGDPMGYEVGCNPRSVIQMVLKVNQRQPCAMDSGNKRKAEIEFLNKIKSPRIDGNGSSLLDKQAFSRQSSFNSLDLNIRAKDHESPDTEAKPKDMSPISSDLTRENTGEVQSPQELLDLIENRFTFNRSPARDREMKEFVASRIKGSFDEAVNRGKEEDNKVKVKVSLGIEDRVLEEVLGGGGDSFIHNVFEKWLRDIFQACLEREKVNLWGAGISVSLCLGDQKEVGDHGGGHGFMSTNLPKKVLVSFV